VYECCCFGESRKYGGEVEETRLHREAAGAGSIEISQESLSTDTSALTSLLNGDFNVNTFISFEEDTIECCDMSLVYVESPCERD